MCAKSICTAGGSATKRQNAAALQQALRAIAIDHDRSWRAAVVRYVLEHQHKKTLHDDIRHFRWLDQYIGGLVLADITTDLLLQLRAQYQSTGKKGQRSPASVNLMLASVRCVLRKAVNEWGWLDRIPYIPTLRHNNVRTTALTVEQARRLLRELPPHLANMALFTLQTGLRAGNVTGLRWSWVHGSVLTIPAVAMKSSKPFSTVLNVVALAVLDKQRGQHCDYVFTYKGNPIAYQTSTKAWRNACRRCGLDGFRWHDLRHTFASWLAQGGVSLPVLQALGGWSSLQMVQRYAHLDTQHLRPHTDQLAQHSAKLLEEIKGNKGS